MKKVTIKDIAHIAGVSRGTVDRVINRRGNVAKSIEKKILKIANELGYEKNLMASTLASNKMYKIAIVCPDPSSDIFWAQPREGITNALELVRHYGIIVEYYDFNLFTKDQFCMQMENAIKSNPDAILTAPVFTSESLEYLEAAEKLNIPFITINTEIDHPDILCYVGQNSHNSGYLAGRLFHLRVKPEEEIVAFNLGHTLRNAQHYYDKVVGLKDYFSSHNMLQNPVFWYEFDQFYDERKLKDFWDEIKSKHPKMKGIFFTNSRAYRIAQFFTDQDRDTYDVIGFDMIEPNIKYLKEDKIDFIINQNPIQQGYSGIMNFVNYFILKKKSERLNTFRWILY
ncbi:MAG: substrate-binding domain-containing protein [Saprospiraceae bacterium]|nr:substrate-binding domain-containing protein [Saprospiraceae bacterium]